MAVSTRSPSRGYSASLSHSINRAISASHSKINRLILDRMPHTLSPNAVNSSTYVTGLLHIGAVYIAFESLWQSILCTKRGSVPLSHAYYFRDSSNTDRNHESLPRQITDRVRHVLETAYWPNMLRAAKIKADIQAMTGWPARQIDVQLRSVGTTGALGTFLEHIAKTIGSKPYMLLAYAYNLYLALLSGGPYIRAELMCLRANFRTAMPSSIRPNMVPCTRQPVDSDDARRQSTLDTGVAGEDASLIIPLSFFDFETPLGHDNLRQQAKDLKAEFKRRFANAEESLIDHERRDIVAESVTIYGHLEAVVEQLDEICGGVTDVVRLTEPPHPSIRPVFSLQSSRQMGVGSWLSDSIANAKGRLSRTLRAVTIPSAVATGRAPAQASSATATKTSERSRLSFAASQDVTKYHQVDHAIDNLARAKRVVPGETSCAIQGDSDGQQYERGDEADGALRHDGYFGEQEMCNTSRRESHACPIFRRSATATAGKRTHDAHVRSKDQTRDYALGVVNSNMASLVSVAAFFAACLLVQLCAVLLRGYWMCVDFL